MLKPGDIAIVAGARTPFGRYCGKIKDYTAQELGAVAAKAAIERSGVDPKDFDHVVFGNAQQTSGDALYGARHVGLRAGLSIETPALTVNRLCGSGMQAIVSAASSILLGETDAAVGGGAESMTRGGYLSPAMRFGARMGDAKMLDMMVGALTDPFDTVHMGITAENVATKCGITREQQVGADPRRACKRQQGCRADRLRLLAVQKRDQ